MLKVFCFKINFPFLFLIGFVLTIKVEATNQPRKRNISHECCKFHSISTIRKILS